MSKEQEATQEKEVTPLDAMVNEQVAAALARVEQLRAEAGPVESRADKLKLRLRFREGQPGYEANCAAIRKEIAALEGGAA